MNSKNISIRCTVLVYLSLVTLTAFSQKVDKDIQSKISEAIKKAYPACVEMYPYDTTAKRQAGGQFSGVVVRADGHILTAAHVVTPGMVYKVIFPDGKEAIAKGLGKIELSSDITIPDVGMIKIITPGNWPYTEIGSSSSLKVDQACLSISYPESLAQSKPIVRFGHVTIMKNDRGFVKSTCMMEPGDSGGGLFDEFGHVIGLHSAIEVPETDNYDVPVDLYLKYWTAINIPRVYTDYPSQKDTLPGTTVSSKIISLSSLKNYEQPASLNSACVIIVSEIKGVSGKISGTVILLQGSKSKLNNGSEVIVSKSSQVGLHPVIICPHNIKVNARILARDIDNDLVLLAPISAVDGGIPVAKLNAVTPDKIQAGNFLISLQPDTVAAKSICGSSVFSLRKMVNGPFLGFAFENSTAPLVVSYIFPNLNNSIYQVQVGDTISSINGLALANFSGYVKSISPYWPGDTVSLQLIRGGVTMTKKMMLDTTPQRHFNHPVEFFNGGKSARRDGFKQVFTHDAIITPDRCGGPVFDLQGNLYGINIARYSRASCLALPCNVILAFIHKTVDD